MRQPKGKLLIIGGAESKGNEEDKDLNMASDGNFDPLEILKKLIPDNRSGGKIEIITTASQMPEKMKERYTKAFSKAGWKDVGFMHMDDKNEVKNLEFIKRAENAHAVFFSGGDQFRLATLMGCTEIISVITKKYLDDPDFIIAGTSAGAMAISKIMIEQGQTKEAIVKGDVRTTSGLGFLDHCIVDTHFITRGRIGRLAQAVITNPSCIGVGLGEDTALLIRNGYEMECLGSGMVIILDCKGIGETNIYYAEEGMPLFVENIVMHILCNGKKFNLKQRRLLIEESDEKKKKERAE